MVYRHYGLGRNNREEPMRFLAIFLMLAGVVSLAGCKDTDRPLSYNKGEYAGKADTKLTAEQVEALRQRGLHTYQ